MWTIAKTETVREKALRLAKGCYQRNVINGIENLSGSTLKGAAKRWGGRYLTSRRHLLQRLRAAGIAVSETKGSHNKRVLVLG